MPVRPTEGPESLWVQLLRLSESWECDYDLLCSLGDTPRGETAYVYITLPDGDVTAEPKDFRSLRIWVERPRTSWQLEKDVRGKCRQLSEAPVKDEALDDRDVPYGLRWRLFAPGELPESLLKEHFDEISTDDDRRYLLYLRGVPLDQVEAELTDLNRRMAKAYQELLGWLE